MSSAGATYAILFKQLTKIYKKNDPGVPHKKKNRAFNLYKQYRFKEALEVFKEQATAFFFFPPPLFSLHSNVCTHGMR